MDIFLILLLLLIGGLISGFDTLFISLAFGVGLTYLIIYLSDRNDKRKGKGAYSPELFYLIEYKEGREPKEERQSFFNELDRTRRYAIRKIINKENN